MKQILAATSNMMARIRELEITANNLSNVNTPGYKRDLYFANILQQQQEVQAGTGFLEAGVDLQERSKIDLAQGALDKTGNPLDLGINGAGFFVVEDQFRGEVYTRNGDFMVDDSGFLVTNTGRRVLGQGGAIEMPPGEVNITKRGKILVDGELIDELRLVLPDQTREILKNGNSEYLFTVREDGEPGDIIQGFLERSNVSPVESMVRLVSLQRDFDSNQKMVQSFDDINKLSANQIGKL